MGKKAVRAILDTVVQVNRITAALIAQSKKRTVTEQTVETFWIRTGMTGEINAFVIMKVFIRVLRHIYLLCT